MEEELYIVEIRVKKERRIVIRVVVGNKERIEIINEKGRD